MPRPLRTNVGGLVYHVLNRANGRATLFETDGDYLAFEETLTAAHARTPVRIVTYCIMPNHFHLVLWPTEDGQLSTFMQWLTVTHTQRWHTFHQTAGVGHLYQGRFKSLPVQTDTHFLRLCRYVERNPVRAGLVPRAEDWRWGGLWRRRSAAAEERALVLEASAWPVDPPRNWLASVNQAETPKELDALRLCVARGRPYGNEAWVGRTSRRLGLESTLRPRGRPRKQVSKHENASKKVPDTFFSGRRDEKGS